MNNAYYQDELRYLREVGPEFARANPELARFLADRGSDPDVERLLEGVAFLCGRIREKLDDELPELTATMMTLLWPHYLRSVPSMSMLEFRPHIEGMRSPLTVPVGSEYASIPIDGTRCRYRSTWPVTLRPWAIKKVALETHAAKPIRLVLQFQAASGAKLEDLQLDRVRVHLAGDPAAAFALYLLLAAHTESVVVSNGLTGASGRESTLGGDSVRSTALDRSTPMLPYPAHAFPGYRLLQEYFAFKERFLFIDFLGLDQAVQTLKLEQTVEVSVVFNRRLESLPLVSTENVRLHCVPIINLFGHEADPIRVRHDRVQYLIQPAKSGMSDRRHAEVYSVDEVHGVSRSTEIVTREYAPFYSFQARSRESSAATHYYQTHITPDVVSGDSRQGTDTYISFVAHSEDGRLPEEESISLELSCTNRHLPSALRAGDICEPTDSSPAGIAFRNIVKPTATISPPIGKGLHWRLISHMSLNYLSLIDVERFKELLRVYDFHAEHDVRLSGSLRRMLEGILSLDATYKEKIVRGAPIRGVQVALALDEDRFAGEGDSYLFATVLDRFFSLYVTLNGYSQLTTRFTRSGQVYRFDSRWGDQVTPAEQHVSAG